MQNKIQEFNFNGNGVHIVDKDGNPWFVAKDVCKCLGIPDNTHVALRKLDDDEKDRCLIPTPGGIQECRIVNEPGLYNLILRSRKPEAKAFKRWVTHEVLPQIRKTGGYITVEPEMSDLDIMVKAFNISQKTIEMQKTEIKKLGTKAKVLDDFTASKICINLRNAAKLLGYNPNKFTKTLRDMGILFYSQEGFKRDRDKAWVPNLVNLPKQQFIIQGYFDCKQFERRTYGGELKVHNHTVVTPKGQVWLSKKLKVS